MAGVTASGTGKPLHLAIVGVGKIARDQHLPAIAADDRFELVAAVSRNTMVEGVPNFSNLADLLAAGIALDAVSICTPPRGRHMIAVAALDAGLHVMIEKPPGATVGEAKALARRVRAGRTLFVSWHSREAAGVAPAQTWLKDKTIRAVRVAWKEDIRVWHPGQDWILEAGGLGVFDPGINALSIVTTLLPAPLLVTDATLQIPANREAPITAMLEMSSDAVSVSAAFDFLQTGPQSWTIEIETDTGLMALHDGGSVIALPGQAPVRGENREYPGLYARFAELIARGASDIDLAPLRIVADAFLVGRHETVAPFSFDG